MECMLCGVPTRVRFSAKDYVEPADPYTVGWCDNCSFGRLMGDFTPERIASFYPADYYTHEAANAEQCKPSRLRKLLFHLAWRLDRSRPVTASIFPHSDSVLDIGCGNGDQLRLFNSSRRVGVDPDPAARAAASSAGEIHAGTAEQLPAIDGKFDVVILSHVLEHCISPDDALKNAASMLSKRGRLMVEVPNNDSLSFDWEKAAWPWTDIPRHLNFFTAASLKRAVEQARLSVVSIEYCGFTRQFTDGWLAKQNAIFDKIGEGRRPNFTLNAIRMLTQAPWLPDSYTHDSIRLFCALAN